MRRGLYGLLIVCVMLFAMKIPACAAVQRTEALIQENDTMEIAGVDALETDEMETAAIETDGIKASLFIDNAHVYEGMDRAYKNGYAPVVKNGTAVIVLPLLAEGQVKNNRITASLSLGKTKASPFIYRNYEKNVALSYYIVVDGTAKKSKTVSGKQDSDQSDEQLEVYYVRFDLPLTEQRYNGIYPVTIRISGQDTAGNHLAQSFTVYCTISDGREKTADGQNAEKETENGSDKDQQTSDDEKNDNENVEMNRGNGDSSDGYNNSNDDEIQNGDNDVENSGDGSSGSEEEKPTSSPVVLISSVSLNPSPVKAGKEFVATVVLHNTSTIKSVQNMVVAVSSETESILLKEKSSSFYVASLDKDKTVELKMHFAVDLDTEEGNYPVNLALTYDDPEAVTLSSSDRFVVPVTQEMHAEFTMPSVAKEVNAGDSLALDLQVMNLGRSKLYNVRCQMTGDGLFPSGTAFIGTLEAGTEGTAAMNVYVGSKDMTEGYTGTEKYGDTTGTVTLIYEDETGKEYTQEEIFHTRINQPVTVSQTEVMEPETAGQWWISVLVAAVFLVTGIFGLIWYRIRKRSGQ